MDDKSVIHNIGIDFHGRRFDAITHDVTLPNGHRTKWNIIHTQPAVAVLPVSTDGESVVILKNYRHAVNSWIYELPAGLIEKGEDPRECAERELLEETGYVAKHAKKIFEIFPSPGFTDEIVHIFMAEIDLRDTQQLKLDNSECLEALIMPKERLFKMVRRQQILDAKTVLALLWLEKENKWSNPLS
jgi:ADP-ribose pyrophosphatase